MLTKDDVNITWEQLSETFSIDEFIDKLIFISKVNRGLKESEDNKIYSHEQTKDYLSKWLQ